MTKQIHKTTTNNLMHQNKHKEKSDKDATQRPKKRYIAPKLTFEGNWDSVTLGGGGFGGVISNAP